MVAPHDCTECGLSIESCDLQLEATQQACCGSCAFNNTHGDPVGGYTERLAARRAAAASAGVDADGVISPDAVAEPGTDLQPATDQQEAMATALMAARAGAGTDLGMPGQAEFADICLMARMLSMSDLAPPKLRDKPYDTLLILLTGRDLGIPLTSALRKISVIEGQPSLDTELQIALVRKQGLGAVLPLADNFTQEVPMWAAAQPVGPGGAPMGPPAVFTWEDAQAAGYVDMGCLPDRHDLREIVKRKRDGTTYKVPNSCFCKDNWRGSPRDMLWWRAAARCRRIYFPEAGTGMYDPSELGQVLDVEGRPVDPATAELPDGWTDPKAEQQQRQANQQAQADARADGAVLWGLQERIRALPPDVRVKMRDAWKANDRIEGRPPFALPARLVKMATAMLNGWEATARQADKGWDRDEARQQVREEVAFHLFAEVVPAMWAPAMVPEPAEPEPEAGGYPEGTEMSPADPTRPISVQERAERGDPDAVARMAVLAELEATDSAVLDDATDQVAAEHVATAAEEPVSEPEPEPGPAPAPEPSEPASDDVAPESEDAEPEPEADPDRDWSEELRQAAAAVGVAAANADDFTRKMIEQEIKAMSWQKVDAALRNSNVVVEGPIDLRRMRLAVIRHSEYQEPF